MKRKVRSLYKVGFVFIALLVFGSFVISSSHGAERFWIGGDGDWTVPDNWDDGDGGPGVPGAGDSVYHLYGDTITYNTTDNPALHYVELDDGTLSQNQGTLTIGTSTWVEGNGFYIGSSGGYNLSGSGALYLPTNGGNWLTIAGVFNQDGGTATVDITSLDGVYTQNSGIYTTGDFYVWGRHDINGGSSDAVGILVNREEGVVNNYGGKQRATVLYLAEDAMGGTYNLYDGGSLETGSSVVSERYSGGKFNQYGGTHTTNDLILGNLASMDGGTLYRGEGTYNLSGGDLYSTGIAKIGNEGIGYFNQTGGNFYANEVWIGVHDNSLYGSYGEYNLSGTGYLQANYLIIGGKDGVNKPGVGVFNQNGGTVQAGGLWVADTEGSVGTYNLYGGDLTVNAYNVVGMRGQGTFNQYGGTHTANYLLELGGSSTANGTYNLVDGVLATNGTIVGSSGTGTFVQGKDPLSGDITSGGTHTVSGDLILGANGGIKGEYNLHGGDLNVDGWAIVGQSGSGYFSQFGGKLELTGGSSDLYIGQNAGSYGEYNLADGSLVTGWQYVGWHGIGVFNQDGGRNVAGQEFNVGTESGSRGTYTLYAGDLETNNAFIGRSNGSVGVVWHSGGTHTVAGNLILGDQAGSEGTYNLSGDSLTSTLTVNGYTIVGNYGKGDFVQTGATHTTDSLWMAEGAGAQGTYDLQDGQLIVAGNAEIGRSGTGLFTQSGGSASINNDLWLGLSGSGRYQQSGGSIGITNGLWLGLGLSGLGSYELSGTGSSLTTGYAVIGDYGTGKFVQQGGSNSVTWDLNLGQESGSTGSYELSDGALSVGGAERIGVSGEGSFNQTDGSHRVTSDLVLANNSGSKGSYDLQGGVLRVGYDTDNNPTSGSTFVGMNGIGTFTQTGGTHTISGGLTLGQEAGSEGTYSLNAGTSGEPNNGILSLGQHEHIGFAGKGTFTQNAGTHTIGRDLVLGNDPTGSGTFNLNGGILSVASNTYVAWNGTGKFNQSGGTHTVAGNLYIGHEATGNGTYKLTGGLLDVTGLDEDNFYRLGYTVIGHNGTGVFNQSGNSEFKARVLVLGGGPYAGDDPAESTGTYNMDGGTLTASLIEVGRDDGKGIFNQTGGSVITDTLAMGDYTGGDGQYTISNDATLQVNGNAEIASATGDGKAVFTQKGASSVTVTGTIWVGNYASTATNGTYDMQSGSLTAPEMIVSQGGHFINSGGTVEIAETTNRGIISGTGEFTGNVTNYGTIEPGSSPGTMTIDGNFTQDSAGTLVIELGGYTQSTEYDFLNIVGNATLSGFLDVNLLSGFDPVADATFNIIHADGELTGAFTGWDLPGLTGGKSFEIVYDYEADDVYLKVLGGGEPPIPTPEPGTLLLLGFGIATLGFAGRRYRN